jgi:hypothetical protein
MGLRNGGHGRTGEEAMISIAVRDQLRERISAGASLDAASDALGRQHRLSIEERSALWLLGRHHIEDPGRTERERRARQILEPTG